MSEDRAEQTEPQTDEATPADRPEPAWMKRQWGEAGEDGPAARVVHVQRAPWR